MEFVTRLGNRLSRRGRAHVALVECSRTHLWKPLLHEVAAGSPDPGEYEVNYFAQARWPAFHYHLGAMTGLDRAAKEVHLAVDFGASVTEVGADGLTLADGTFIALDGGLWPRHVRRRPFARAMYQSLRLMHERTLNGTAYAVLGLFSRALSRRTGPPVKLH